MNKVRKRKIKYFYKKAYDSIIPMIEGISITQEHSSIPLYTTYTSSWAKKNLFGCLYRADCKDENEVGYYDCHGESPEPCWNILRDKYPKKLKDEFATEEQQIEFEKSKEYNRAYDKCQARINRECEKLNSKWIRLQNSQTVLTDIISSHMINLNLNPFFAKGGREDLRDAKADVYKVSSAPNYLENTRMVIIYKDSRPSISFNSTFKNVINSAINYLNQKRTRKAFYNLHKRYPDESDVIMALKKIRYVIYDPRENLWGGEAWMETGVVFVSHKDTEKQIHDVLWHEIVIHMLNGLTPKQIEKMKKEESDFMGNYSNRGRDLFGFRRNEYNEDEINYMSNQVAEEAAGETVFKYMTTKKFDTTSREDLNKKISSAMPRIIDQSIDELKKDLEDKAKNLNADEIALAVSAGKFEEEQKRYNSLLKEKKKFQDKSKRILDYELRKNIVKEYVEFTGVDDNFEPTSTWRWVEIDKGNTYEQQQEYKDEFINDHCLESAHRLFLHYFGENHWAEKSMFDLNGKDFYNNDKKCIELKQSFLDHLLDDEHRQGGLRALYNALSNFSDVYPIPENLIIRAINFRMPKSFYSNNLDAFRFLMLLKADGKTIKYIYDMQNKIVNLDKNLFDNKNFDMVNTFEEAIV